MHCRRGFDREILTTGLSRAFVDGPYKLHRAKVLFERELAMMAATHPYVEQELQRRANARQLGQMRLKRARLAQKLRDLNRAIDSMSRAAPQVNEDERRTFVHHCAQHDCRGFLSSAWKCGVCGKYTCSECNAPRGADRDDGHVCEETDRETMCCIRHDSKKCPGCAEYIFKVSGCDQMWCTSCHTAFSWRTGLKVNGAIHNPHFYEFSRQGGAIGRVAGDIPCGGMPTPHEIVSAQRTHCVMHAHDVDLLMGLHRMVMHVENDELRRWHMPDVNEATNRDLRIQYTLSEITEANFKSKVQQREKMAEKRREIHQVLELVAHTGADIFRGALIDHDYNRCIASMTALIEYANATMQTVSRKYKCVVPRLCPFDMSVTTTRYAACGTHESRSS